MIKLSKYILRFGLYKRKKDTILFQQYRMYMIKTRKVRQCRDTRLDSQLFNDAGSTT